MLKHSLWLGLLLSSNVSELHAQAPGWQPNRLPQSSSMQPLAGNSAAPVGNQSAHSSSSTTDQGNSGVVLRWRTSPRASDGSQSSSNAASSGSAVVNQVSAAAGSSSMAARALDANTMRASTSTASSVQAAQYTARASADLNSTAPSSSSAANPLRSSAATNNARATTATTNTFVPRGTNAGHRSAVQPANFQAPAGNVPQINMPQAPGAGGSIDNSTIAPPNFAIPNNASNLQAPPNIDPPAALPPSTFPQDALNVPENAPAPPVAPPVQDEFPKTPGLGNAPAQDANPAAPMPGSDNELRLPDSSLQRNLPPKEDDATDPFRNRRTDDLESPSDRESARRSRELEKKKDQPDSSANCEAFRDKLRSSSIQKINLNAAPRYGQGLSDDPVKSEKQRLDFAASSEVRDWCDRSGRTVIQGRMIDLINEQVVLDVNGVRREIPLRDLCDVDLAYVGKVWHLPITCGSGNEQFAGRSFVPSAVQWKASGLCHKPLYFEEVQLERYGHEIGPILQPLVSTAHFFGNIAVLPYKMGIHPPHECQYSLGYYRPGDCAPYMLPPVPISLRGAAVQAGAVVGGAALLP